MDVANLDEINFEKFVSKLKDPVAHSYGRELFLDVARFAVESMLSHTQVETLLTIFSDVVAEDVKLWQRTATESFNHFQDMMLKCSVERPPWSRGMFEPSMSVAITTYILHVYYRHYKLYKYCVSSVPDGKFVQVSPGDVEPPAKTKPLGDAIPVTRS